MKIKVCGMKYRDNIEELILLRPDFIGFIFYPGSPRFVFNELDEKYIQSISTIEKVGVFVNETIKNVLNVANKYKLDTIQLHGHETPEYCHELAKEFKIIKAFKADEQLKKMNLSLYDSCSYFLFDSPGKNHGGNGVTFSYDLLNEIEITKPFLLSGGLHHSELGNIPSHPNLIGLDVNSRYEISPGLKNISELKELKNKVYELDTIRN